MRLQYAGASRALSQVAALNQIQHSWRGVGSACNSKSTGSSATCAGNSPSTKPIVRCSASRWRVSLLLILDITSKWDGLGSNRRMVNTRKVGALSMRRKIWDSGRSRPRRVISRYWRADIFTPGSGSVEHSIESEVRKGKPPKPAYRKGERHKTRCLSERSIGHCHPNSARSTSAASVGWEATSHLTCTARGNNSTKSWSCCLYLPSDHKLGLRCM
jgi:hypothetical protein